MQALKIGFLMTAVLFGSDQAQAAGPVVKAPAVPANVQTIGTQWIVTSDGCSYSRTQAPGYPAQWYLIQNPHHIGQPNAHPRCAPVLGG